MRSNFNPSRERTFWFVFSLLAGIALGVLYGWLINPAQLVDASPNTLRKDYKTDYVLMVAETYTRENDAEQAARRLALLGSDSPVRLVQRAVLDGQEMGYASADLEILGNLLQGLQVWQGTQP
jgi:hypothetical protein